MTTLSSEDITAADLAGWTHLDDRLETRLLTGNFRTGMQLVASIGEAAEAADHHPDLDLRYPHLDVRLTSHDEGGVTERDVALARQISTLATDAGVEQSTESAD